MKLFSYLAFENAKEAMGYYEEVFGAKVLAHNPITKEMAMKWNKSTTDIEKTTMHAAFAVLGNTILCSDRMTHSEDTFNTTTSMCLDFNTENTDDMDELERLYQSVVSKGNVTINMPLEEQFWGGKMGMVTDKFGLQWMFHAQPYSKLENK